VGLKPTFLGVKIFLELAGVVFNRISEAGKKTRRKSTRATQPFLPTTTHKAQKFYGPARRIASAMSFRECRANPPASPLHLQGGVGISPSEHLISLP
jgi:hypothetical protein